MKEERLLAPGEKSSALILAVTPQYIHTYQEFRIPPTSQVSPEERSSCASMITHQGRSACVVCIFCRGLVKVSRDDENVFLLGALPAAKSKGLGSELRD